MNLRQNRGGGAWLGVGRKAVGRGDKTSRRVRVRVLALIEKAHRDRVSRYLGDQTTRRDRVRVLALLEKAHRDRVLDRWIKY